LVAKAPFVDEEGALVGYPGTAGEEEENQGE